ncbi:MAG TPA: hypothetical protein VFJ82_18180 [Longimicrobium sp.]|nr:hypothetical protein [Longimicrobium sp.]
MYRHCIYCSADLGANESIEHFPVGRQVAFDAEKGRLWAVCPRCARWNLAPIEERWEAVQEAERRFADMRLRVQRENIGLAKLADGTRLVRVGPALPGELAAWRYGETLARRRTRFMVTFAAVAAVPVALLSLEAAGVLGGGMMLGQAWWWIGATIENRRRIYEIPATNGRDVRVDLRRKHLQGARLTPGRGGGVHLELPNAPTYTPDGPLVVRGTDAVRLLERAMVVVNEGGARKRHLRGAVEALASAGTAQAYLARAAREERALLANEHRSSRRTRCGAAPRLLDRVEALALEMALHEETERRALEGELALLEAAWRDAERIAAIADRLAMAPQPPQG